MKHSKGFTLIEVLIAFVILLTVVGSISFAYRSAVLSNTKAASAVEMESLLSLLMPTIRARLLMEKDLAPQTQEGILNDTVFSWQAKVVEKGSAPRQLSPEDGDWIEFPERYYLWNVTITFKRDFAEREYSFKVLTWSKL
ncbi:type II secretion system protein J [Shewanella sp. FJAT-52076]|uniref:PulJ/GspJ family protein n=1 Tax=Shewanella sp. FJAT-52076 TaxID=2864202 RepID=UPI001C65A895|nr:prepilin-type N-terminal cleavage/methylation domain-containing protein [Shewanella sp. FJAT-52076]QYJ74055.1 prepilin-type N-terminal cleavage/methylation domain-containing protein [Shewanella sp. FJAT-52076]